MPRPLAIHPEAPPRRASWYHLVAHAIGKLTPLVDAGLAYWLWRRLRRAFPDVAAACLMPNHVHILLFTDDAESARLHLARALGGFTRHVGERRLWETSPATKVAADPKHLRRTVRYIHLNPCRDRLVRDPLAWRWSTHRGTLGAEVTPWVDLRRLARAIEWKRPFAELGPWFHRYVSADPDSALEGTPLPTLAERREWPSVALPELISAAEAATPWSTLATRRHAVALLAEHQGHDDWVAVGRALGISAHMARRWSNQAEGKLLRAAALCLGDARLRSVVWR